MTESWPSERGLERLLFFSDAVFAIAITLLVIDIRVPALADNVSPDAFNRALIALLPRIFAYALSFVLIGRYWLAHWRRYHWIERSDGPLASLNLLLLGFIAFLPFPTSLMGAHGDRPIAVAIYAVSVSLPGIVGAVTWLYATRAELVRPGVSPEIVRFGAIQSLTFPGVMLSSLVVLPFVHPYLVEGAWALIFVVYLLVARRLGPSGASV